MDYAAILKENTQPKRKIPVLKPGQTIRVHCRIIEGSKERIQIFEGLVIGIKGSGINKTCTVRKISMGIGVERTWPVFSPSIEKIEVVKQSRVRRAKLNFIRGLTKKQSRLREKFGDVLMEGIEEAPLESIAEAGQNDINNDIADKAEENKEAPSSFAKVEEKSQEG